MVGFNFGFSFDFGVGVVGCEMCHTQARRLRRPRSTKFDPPHPPLLLRHLLLDPLQLMRHGRRNTLRIILIIAIPIPTPTLTHTEIPHPPPPLLPAAAVVFSTNSINTPTSRLIASCSANTPSSARISSTWLAREVCVLCSWGGGGCGCGGGV